MQVFQPNGARFDLALERLRVGSAFSFNDVSFWLASDGCLEIGINSSWRIENTTEETAL